MEAIIVGNSYEDKKSSIMKERYLNKNILKIAADGGIEFFHKCDIIPHYIVGDLDSAKKGSFIWAIENGSNVYIFEKRKDLLDSEIAIILSKELKCSKIYLYGFLGGRIDQTYASLLLLKKLHTLGIEGNIIDENLEIGYIKGPYEGGFETIYNQNWSFLPCGPPCEGLSIQGFEYNLSNSNLAKDSLLTISNKAKNKRVGIKITKGELYYFKF